MPTLIGTMTGAPTLSILGDMQSPVAEVAGFDIRFQIVSAIEESGREGFVNSFNGVDPDGDGTPDLGVITQRNTPVSFTPTSNNQFNTVEINQRPTDGTVSVTDFGITYIPDPNFKGIDVIGFTLLQGASIVGLGMVYLAVLETVDGAVVPGTVLGGGQTPTQFIEPLDDCAMGGEWREKVNQLINQNNRNAVTN